MNKPNCYDCKWRREAGSYTCHSKCVHPSLDEKGRLLAMVGLFNPLNIKGDSHGIKNGWFMWPLDFDPIWLDNCNGFEKLEGKEVEK
jgi:hypothetical protein